MLTRIVVMYPVSSDPSGAAGQVVVVHHDRVGELAAQRLDLDAISDGLQVAHRFLPVTSAAHHPGTASGTRPSWQSLVLTAGERAWPGGNQAELSHLRKDAGDPQVSAIRPLTNRMMKISL
jgi:hypothetical protein